MKQQEQIDELLEKELSRPLDFVLSEGFSHRVMQKITLQQEVQATTYSWLLNVAVIGFAMLSVICLLIFVPANMKSSLIQIVGWSIPLGILIAVFQYLDQRFVRKNISMS